MIDPDELPDWRDWAAVTEWTLLQLELEEVQWLSELMSLGGPEIDNPQDEDDLREALLQGQEFERLWPLRDDERHAVVALEERRDKGPLAELVRGGRTTQEFRWYVADVIARNLLAGRKPIAKRRRDGFDMKRAGADVDRIKWLWRTEFDEAYDVHPLAIELAAGRHGVAESTLATYVGRPKQDRRRVI